MSEPVRVPQPQAVLGFIRWAAVFVAIGALLYLVGIVWTGWAAVLAALFTLGIPALCAGATMASGTYLLRFGRWHLALRWLGNRVPWFFNLKVYLAGLALTTSPGKLGETFRSVLLLQHGVPASRSLGAFFADRLSDVLGVCLLGAAAGAVQGDSLNAAAIGGVVIAIASFLFRWLVTHSMVVGLGDRLPSWARRSGRLASGAMQEWAMLWRPGRVLLFVILAMLAYGIQAGVFAWYCQLLGLQLPLVQAIGIFANAILLGAASMVPGGLGAMEAALVVQLTNQGADMSVAVSVAIAVRLVTLWVGVLVGIVSLLNVASKMKDKVNH